MTDDLAKKCEDLGIGYSLRRADDLSAAYPTSDKPLSEYLGVSPTHTLLPTVIDPDPDYFDIPLGLWDREQSGYTWIGLPWPYVEPGDGESAQKTLSDLYTIRAGLSDDLEPIARRISDHFKYTATLFTGVVAISQIFTEEADNQIVELSNDYKYRMSRTNSFSRSRVSRPAEIQSDVESSVAYQQMAWLEDAQKEAFDFSSTVLAELDHLFHRACRGGREDQLRGFIAVISDNLGVDEEFRGGIIDGIVMLARYSKELFWEADAKLEMLEEANERIEILADPSSFGRYHGAASGSHFSVSEADVELTSESPNTNRRRETLRVNYAPKILCVLRELEDRRVDLVNLRLGDLNRIVCNIFPEVRDKSVANKVSKGLFKTKATKSGHSLKHELEHFAEQDLMDHERNQVELHQARVRRGLDALSDEISQL